MHGIRLRDSSDYAPLREFGIFRIACAALDFKFSFSNLWKSPRRDYAGKSGHRLRWRDNERSIPSGRKFLLRFSAPRRDHPRMCIGYSRRNIAMPAAI